LRQRQPPPFQVKSAEELHPNFKPKWVILRNRLMWFSGVLAIGFIAASVQRYNGTALAILICAWCVLSVAVPMKHLPGMARLAGRTFPAQSARIEAILTGLEFDLDWDETRR